MIIAIIRSLIILTACISPFVVDYSNLPLGYEIPKAIFVQIIAFIVLCLFLIHKFIKRDFRLFPKKQRILQTLPLALLLIGLVASTFNRPLDQYTAIWGNEYRYQGLIFLLLMISLSYIFLDVLNKQTLKILFVGLAISGTMQSAVAIGQFANFLSADPAAISEGLYVNGTFGQSNFFGGSTLVTIASLIFLGGVAYARLKTRLRSLTLIGIFTLITVNISSIIISYSKGSIILLIIMLISIVFINLIQRSKAKWTIWLLRLSLLPLSVIFIWGFNIFISGDFRANLWFGVLENFNSFPIFGFGLDNQHLFYARSDSYSGFLIDRSHNIFIDTIITMGRFGIFALIIFLTPSIIRLSQIYLKLVSLSKKTFLLSVISSVLLVISIRVLVHTNSVVNVVHLALIFAVWSWLISKTFHLDTSETK